MSFFLQILKSTGKLKLVCALFWCTSKPIGAWKIKVGFGHSVVCFWIGGVVWRPTERLHKYTRRIKDLSWTRLFSSYAKPKRYNAYSLRFVVVWLTQEEDYDRISQGSTCTCGDVTVPDVG